MAKEEKMRTGRFNSKQMWAMKVILRRRAELEFRIASKIGSEASLRFDEKERAAINVLVEALTEKNENSSTDDKKEK
jgi:hypothetical protein